MLSTDFNKLSSKDKWHTWKNQHGVWTCSQCGHEVTNGPTRAEPFHGCSVHCGNCHAELTRRTGGGMCDPFNWILNSFVVHCKQTTHDVYIDRPSKWGVIHF